MQHRATVKKQGNQSEEGSQTGDEGPAQYLIDTVVDGLIADIFLGLRSVFPDTVENYHRVVKGISCQSEKGGDNEQREFHVHEPAHADHYKNIVEGGDGCGDAEANVE